MKRRFSASPWPETSGAGQAMAAAPVVSGKAGRGASGARPHRGAPGHRSAEGAIEGAPGDPPLTIGKLARLAAVSADTIRFYEDERLLMPARKTEAGYRLYGLDARRRLDFIKHAQHCGLTLAEIRQLLDMRADDSACCNDIRSLAMRKKLELEHKIQAMRSMSQALGHLIEACTAGIEPVDSCPILAALESSAAPAEPSSDDLKQDDS